MHKHAKRYLDLAKHISTWSKDPSTKVGAVAVSDSGQILAIGYNGIPRNLEDSEERLNNRELKYKYIVHAEQNLIYNACQIGVSLKDSHVYVWPLMICSECSKALIQSGVKSVTVLAMPDKEYARWKESCDLATQMFKEANIKYNIMD